MDGVLRHEVAVEIVMCLFVSHKPLRTDYTVQQFPAVLLDFLFPNPPAWITSNTGTIHCQPGQHLF